jgi:hypothetical protein
MRYQNMLAAVLVALAPSAAPDTGRTQPAPQSFTFGLMGDLGYVEARETMFENVLAEINATPLAFVAHVGDLSSPRLGCDNAFRARRIGQFNAVAHPLIYTPGDNEWTDCSDPLERLANLRSLFFNGKTTLGQRTFPLDRQSDGDPAFAKYRENVRWEFGGVMFFTLHAVGSNNGVGRSAAGDAEAAERTTADIAWMRQGFALAQTNNSRAIMILQQANIFPDILPFTGDPAAKVDGFADLRAALVKELQAYDKPVVLVNGDSHYFRIEKPFMRRVAGAAGDPLIENFTRVETFGDPFNHWVHVTVDANDPNVFTFRQRMVPANLLKKK